MSVLVPLAWLYAAALLGGGQQLCAGARHPVSALSAPLRGAPAEALPDLQRAFADESFRADVNRLLAGAKLSGLAEPLFSAVALGEDVTRIALAPGTRFEWMAARDGKAAAPVRREQACWNGRESLDAWLIPVPAPDRKRDYAFILPVRSVNLSLLPWEPPVCHLAVKTDCTSITLDAGASTPGARPITRYLWTVGEERKEGGEPVLRRPLPCPPGEACRIEASVQAVDQVGQRSQRCTQSVERAPCSGSPP